jgi:hypothetical protein
MKMHHGKFKHGSRLQGQQINLTAKTLRRVRPRNDVAQKLGKELGTG